MKVLIMAGGTGGHVFPALAIAKAFQAQGTEVFWLGTTAGIEAEKIPTAGIPIFYIPITGMRGKKIAQLIKLPWRLFLALWKALQIIKKIKPDVVIGMGGFVSGPGGVAASLLRIPLVIHEQNAIAGFTNRCLSYMAKKILIAFPKVLSNGICVGNPVDARILALPEPRVRFAERNDKLRVLVLGGSLGAQAINETVPQAIMGLPLEVWHQTGAKHLETTRKAYQTRGLEANIVPFIEDMASAYAWADVVICRAGALTVSELAVAGVGSILIPFPHAVDDHQTENGQYLVRASAALMIQQTQFTPEWLIEKLTMLNRTELCKMAEAARSVGQRNATQLILQEVKTCLS